MRFFFDRCMALRIAKMVGAYETTHTILHHDEDSRFHKKTPDTEWIGVLGTDEPKWVVISGDGQILKNRVERAALSSANLTFFCMDKAWMNMKLHEYAWKFIKVWPEIVETASRHKSKLFKVTGGSSLKIEPLE
jgi:PIN like domain